MDIDLSNYVSSRIFFQLDNNKLIHLGDFFSKNLNLAKYNCEIYDKELLAIIRWFE